MGKLIGVAMGRNDLRADYQEQKTSFKICCDNITENVNKNQSIKTDIET